ncbi:MAG: BppU family phage baseplate upper protein [Clostridia bacterium]|nr:BppU family phage baseplate upper protein [Clostridia bacterium]
MAIYEKPISLDLSAEDKYKHISAKQGDYDSRYLRVTVLSDGTMFKLVDSDAVALRCTHEDNTFDMDIGTVNDDGTVSVKIPKSILSRIGSVDCDVSIAREGCGLISTSSFLLKIEKSSLTGNIDTGDDIKTPSELFAEISANTEARHKHNNIDTLHKISESENGSFLFNGEEIKQTTDTELSENSENAIQNKVVASKFKAVEEDISYLEKSAEELQSDVEQAQTDIGILEEWKSEAEDTLDTLDSKSHTHTFDEEVLNNLGEDDEGKLTYKGSEIKQTVDSELSDESENPVQNKVIKAELDKKIDVNNYLNLRSKFIANDYSEGYIEYNSTEKRLYFIIYDEVITENVICASIDLVYENNIYNVHSLKNYPEFIYGYDSSDTTTIKSAIASVFNRPSYDEAFGYIVGRIDNAARGEIVEALQSFSDSVSGFYLHYYEGGNSNE